MRARRHHGRPRPPLTARRPPPLPRAPTAWRPLPPHGNDRRPTGRPPVGNGGGTAQAARQRARADEFLGRADAARTAGEDPERFEKLATNIGRAADRSIEQATALNADAMKIMLTGLALLAVFKLVQGLYANKVYEKQYSKWRIDAKSVESGFSRRRAALAAR